MSHRVAEAGLDPLDENRYPVHLAPHGARPSLVI
jgi:hypothetical protein